MTRVVKTIVALLICWTVCWIVVAGASGAKAQPKVAPAIVGHYQLVAYEGKAGNEYIVLDTATGRMWGWRHKDQKWVEHVSPVYP